MAKKPAVDPKSIPPHVNPAEGGSYVKDPGTGELTRVFPPPADPEVPAEDAAAAEEVEH